MIPTILHSLLLSLFSYFVCFTFPRTWIFPVIITVSLILSIFLIKGKASQAKHIAIFFLFANIFWAATTLSIHTHIGPGYFLGMGTLLTSVYAFSLIFRPNKENSALKTSLILAMGLIVLISTQFVDFFRPQSFHLFAITTFYLAFGYAIAKAKTTWRLSWFFHLPFILFVIAPFIEPIEYSSSAHVNLIGRPLIAIACFQIGFFAQRLIVERNRARVLEEY